MHVKSIQGESEYKVRIEFTKLMTAQYSSSACA